MKYIFWLLICCSLASDVQPLDVVIIVGTTAVVPRNPSGASNCIDQHLMNHNKTSITDNIFGCFHPPSAPTEAPGDPLRLESGPLNIERNEGESITFTCIAEGFQVNDTFTWRSPKRAFPVYLKQGTNTVTPIKSPRFTYSSTNLSRWEMSIRDLRKGDAGVYSCGVTSLRINVEGIDKGGDPGGTESRYFNLTVQYVVSIRGILPNTHPHVVEGRDNHILFNETDDVELSCLSDGVPTPDTYWRRGNSSLHNLPSGEEISLGRNLSIYNISIRDAGVYVCESKQLLNADLLNTTIIVQHKPIVLEEQKLIRKKKGSSVQLHCHIDSKPLPFVAEWYNMKDGREIMKGTQTPKTGSSYFITSLNPIQHYGNYTCVVTNILGSGTCHFEITGRPAKPKIVSSPNSTKMRVYTLQWTYEDYDITKLKTFRINYTQKKYKDKADFLEYEVPSVYNPKRPMEYNTTIHDLRANSTYYLRLFAVNKYGPGDIEIFEFTTAAVDKIPPPRKSTQTDPMPKGAGRWLHATLHTNLCSIVLCVILLWK